MNVANIKADLFKLIEQTDDISVLKAIKVLLRKQTKKEKDFWDELPDMLKEEIEEGLRDIESGNVIPHEEAMKRFEECH